ncbi:MAG: hypothetical protein WC426_13625 [Sulfuriferula sp.]
MAKVDTAQLAQILGKTDDAAFEQAVNAAVADLERLLNYPLCGSADFETRQFGYPEGYLWLKTHPFYEVETVTTVVDGVETVVASGDLQYGQNGRLFGSWFNGIKLCNKCNIGNRCNHYNNCDYIIVSAKWGFCPPTELAEESPGDESPGEPEYVCCLPDDLYNVLVEAVGQALDPKSDVQSENVGTRSYSKFTKAFGTIWEKYASVIEFYRLREPRV